MRRGALALALIGLPLVPHGAAAASERIDGVLKLEQAAQRVGTAGFDVRAARGAARVADADSASARAVLRPQLGISANALDANQPQLGMPIARQAYAAASLSLPLWAPSSHLASRAASLSARAASIAVTSTVSDAVFQAVQAYRRAQLAEAILDARSAAVRDQADHLRLSEIRVRSGKSPRYVVARDRAGLAIAQQNQEDAAAERDEARNDLAALLDLSLDSRFTTEPLAPIPFADDRSAVAARAFAQRPALASSQEQVIAAEARVAAARGAYVPSAQLSAQSYNGTSTAHLGRSGGEVAVTASLPIFDGGGRAAAVERARGELDRAAAMRDQMRRNVERDVADAFRELEAARRNLTTAQAAQNDADEQLRIARVRERAGKGIELEVLDALAVNATAHENALRALSRYDVAIAAVHHAAGDPST
jgi:outer membrane protein TolC